MRKLNENKGQLYDEKKMDEMKEKRAREFRRREEQELDKRRELIFDRRMKNVSGSRRGFTLIEILVVIGIIAVLAAVVLVAINPARQFKLARDSQRVSNINALLNSISQNIAEHHGVFTCGNVATALPALATVVKKDATVGGFDLAPCVVPAYISVLPFDPSASGAHYAGLTDYNTQYVIYQDTDGRVTASSTGELTPSISVTR